MSDNKKYYYLKLKDNFYDRPEIKAIESIPNGYEYICIMQKMYLRSLERNGKLMLTDRIPYNVSTLVSVLGHRSEVIQAAIEIFKQFGLLIILDDKTIYMTEIQNFIGKSSSEGDRKRESRNEIEIHQNLLNGHLSDIRPPEIEIELKKEIKIEKKKKTEFIPPTESEVKDYCTEQGYDINAKEFINYYSSNQWRDKNNSPVKNWKMKMQGWFKNAKVIVPPKPTMTPEDIERIQMEQYKKYQESL